MPSRKRRPSRRRKQKPAKLWMPPTDWSPWLWGLFAVNLVFGLYFSPVTGLRTVRVVGVPSYDRDRIAEYLAALRDVPYLRVSKEKIQTFALEDLAMEQTDFRANLFGRGVLEPKYKRAVARIEGKDRLYLSSGGSVFPSPLDWRLTVTVAPPYPVAHRNLSVFSSWRTRVAARMCENIGEKLPDTEWRLVVSRTGFVELESEAGGAVEFGSFEDADLKVQTLEKILKDKPGYLGRVRKLVLTNPSAPVEEI